jgi:HPt (histidine-containing phosphotransfer) domain-containing protein
MPDLDDSEVTQELGQNNSKIAAPLILLGESKMKHELDPNLALRSDNLMLKPVSKDLLTRTLAKYSKSQVHFFDRALALRQVMGKDVFLLTMLKKFAKLCRGYICQFEAEQSSTDLALLAHTIKGAAAGLGFNRLAEAAKLLELHIKRTGGIKERALVSNLKLKLKQAESYLAIECQGD